MWIKKNNYKLKNTAAFPQWAKPKISELSLKRNKTLLEDKTILWNMKSETGTCVDHIEMSGFKASSIICYGKNDAGALMINRHLVVPSIRFIPDVTQSSFSYNFTGETVIFKVNDTVQQEKATEVRIRGNLCIKTQMEKAFITRQLIQCADAPALVEKMIIKAKEDCKLSISVPVTKSASPKNICRGGVVYSVSCAVENGIVSSGNACGYNKIMDMKKEQEHTFYIVYFAYRNDIEINIENEIKKRNEFIDCIFSALTLESGNAFVDAQFSHCNLRGCESIYKTESGLFHSPGGGNYYAALWTNDQCEYANPFFPFIGYDKAIESAVNCYRLYENYMDKSDTPFCEKRALVTSIISEGRDYWNGAGDRGDGSMYAYGICRFLLCMGDKELCEDFFDDIKWCIDFALSRKDKNGIIKSDSDELENRFESSDANLNTSCLTYDALLNGSIICNILGKDELGIKWKNEAEELKNSIENYFGANVEGFDTYQYYDGNKDLRSWICTPLSVEIFDRKEETLKALFSDRLYHNAMLKSTSENETTWDRSLLFALRGAFLAGYDEAFDKTAEYAKERLVGNHSPYPFEAFPEGNRAHLSAESILFSRIITEGLFGLRAVGYRKLRIAPQKDNISLKGLHLFGESFDIRIENGKTNILFGGKTYTCEKRNCVFDFDRGIYDEG